MSTIHDDLIERSVNIHWPATSSSTTSPAVLGDGVTFNWTTFGLKIASTVAEYVPHTRIGWYGTGDQLRALSHLAAHPPQRRPAPTSSWKRPEWAPPRNTSPGPIPATCTAVTTCGTSASSSRAKADPHVHPERLRTVTIRGARAQPVSEAGSRPSGRSRHAGCRCR